MSKQRLIVLFDGTWNDPEDQTNVYRLSRSIRDYDGETRQRFFYDPGIGTSTFSRLRGGVSGWGLSKNIMQGYEWLAKHYAEGDEIWIFGFSRGAYTARSLAGVIRKCGLLHISTPRLLKEVEKLYRNKEHKPKSNKCSEFRHTYSRDVKIHFMGVWDTVGALGIPGTILSEKGRFSWHDTQLSKIVERAYHAMALDEHREAYNTSLWTHPSGEIKPEQISVEQRWFIGAHANVGGGYGKDPLATLPLEWIQTKACEAGLSLEPYEASDTAWKAKITDSFKRFMKGIYSLFKRLTKKGDGRFYRNFSHDEKGNPGINITVDPSVWKRWQSESGYRPPTLTKAGQVPPGE
ncbi:DUF2235 domain-containing protein [Verrucomicrobiota bacterium]